MATLDQVMDPVCGMLIDPAVAAGSREHRGQTYHLCSPGCLVKFDGDADAYIAASRVEGYRTWQATILTHVNSAPGPGAEP
jgi:YHS domain-containing protein